MATHKFVSIRLGKAAGGDDVRKRRDIYNDFDSNTEHREEIIRRAKAYDDLRFGAVTYED